MSRIDSALGSAITLNLSRFERVLVEYYASRHRQRKGVVIRAMIRKFALYDDELDPEALLDFVSAHFQHDELLTMQEAWQLNAAAGEIVNEWEELRENEV